MLFDVYVSNHVFGIEHVSGLKKVNFIESLLFPG